MNRPSKEPGRENVQCIRTTPLPVVVTMQARSGRAEGEAARVVQMPARFHSGERKAAVVVPMRPASNCMQIHSPSIVEMPSRIGDSGEAGQKHGWSEGFGDGLRMTLVALFALLGWPRPTHGKDPGAAAARPWKLELLNVVSRLQIPAASLSRQMAAQAPVLQFPRPVASENLGADLASAA